MVPALRKLYNEQFTNEKYNTFINDLSSAHPEQLDFRVAETPLFIPRSFKQKMLDACESIIDIIRDEKFKLLTENAIPQDLQVPGENDHSHFIAFDFGICMNKDGDIEPQLIEMQGFPSLFAYQVLLPEINAKHFFHPQGYDNYLSGFTKESYISLLKEILLGDFEPGEVILLEIFPEKQKTRIDFFCTEDYTGIKPVCITELIVEGKHLFYLRDSEKIRIKRIYNRLIFDDLLQQAPEVQEKGKILFNEMEVEWVPHPNWFYRISKYTLPFIRHPYVPSTFFLSEIVQLPADLDQYVLKPLFSFAGQGVIIDVTEDDIKKVKDPKNWILQRKVNYANIIDTPGEMAKAEIRLFYFWKDGTDRPVATNNLARISKGKMVGVRYNKDKDWVGGTFAWFEK